MKRLTLRQQGKLVYALSPFEEPRLTINPGETLVIETEDAYSGQIRKGGDRRDTNTMPFSNPQTGPIYIKGAEKNDTLVVHILEIKPMIGQGATRLPHWWWYQGDLTSASLAGFLSTKIPHGTRICQIKEGLIHFSDRIKLPFDPLIGTIGTAPEVEALSSDLPGPHGGNMDLPDVKTGNTLYLPVRVPGALLYAGDAHATQGDGEICGTAIEMPAELTLRVDLIKNRNILWPRIESREYLMAVSCSGSGRTLEDALRLAFVELIRWLEVEYGFNRWEAYQLCSQAAKIRIGNVWTVAARFPKRYL